MILPEKIKNEFFNNYLPLLFYTAVYEGLLPEKSKITMFAELSLEAKIACRDVLFSDQQIIRYYKKDNADFLKTATPDFLDQLQRGIFGNFVLLSENKNKTVFMDMGSPNKFYHVTGISDPVSHIAELPAYAETAIFNFQNFLICDGLIKSGVLIGPNYKKSFLTDYKINLKAGKVIDLL